MLCACGDDVTEVNEIHQDGIAVLEAGLELSKQKCDAENVGEMLFVTDSAEVFFCDGKTWQTTKGADGKDGKDGVGKDGKIGPQGPQGETGKPGEPGADGDDGNDGESCTAKQVKNAAGIEGLEVTCGKTVVGTIWNGSKGEQGERGEDGKDLIATTGTMGSFIDNRDGQIYKTVVIGAQTWMAQNLNYAYNESTSSLDSSSFCFGDDPNNCDTYGRLYLWSAAMDSAAIFSNTGKGCGYNSSTCSASGPVQGVCPSGWHLPTYAEWETLFSYVGNEVGSSYVGTALKTASGWYSQTGGVADRDVYGFSALPAGYRSYDGDFDDAGLYAFFWSSSGNGSYYAYSMYLFYYDENACLSGNNKGLAFSIRCLQN